jgi:KDO2-lipid IV(A) lauroyltransferase
VKIRFLAEWILLRVSLGAFSRMSARDRTAVAAFLGRCTFSLLRIRRDVTLANLRIAFGSNMNTGQIQRLGIQSYANLALSAMELAALTRSTGSQAADACSVEGDAHLHESLSLNRGVILVTGHLGNWELLAASLAAKGHPVMAVAARMKNPLVHAWITRLRERFGLLLIPTGKSSARKVMRALKSGGIVLLLIPSGVGRPSCPVAFDATPLIAKP